MTIGRRVRGFLCFIGLVLALPVNAQAATVFADGREWRQVTETVNTSWNTLASYCDSGTGVCGGAYEGWTWASRADVVSLFESYLVPDFTSDFSSGSFFTGSAIPANQFLSLFAPTHSSFVGDSYYSALLGVTRDLVSFNGTNFASRAFVDARSESANFSSFSRFNALQRTTLANTAPDMGAWMYTTAAPVPEPEIYAMMGLGLGLVGWAGRRKKLREVRVA